MRAMMRRWVVSLVVATLGSVAVTGPSGSDAARAAPPVIQPAALEADGSLANMFPAGTLLYKSWPGFEALAASADGTALARLMREAEVVRLRTDLRVKVLPAIEGLIAEEMGPDAPPGVIPAVKEVLAAFWTYPGAFGVAGLGVGETGPTLDAAIVLRAGRDAPSIAGRLEALARLAGLPLDETKEVRVGDATFKELPLPVLPVPLALRWGVLGDDVIVTIGDGMLQHLSSRDPARGLGRSDRFAKAMSVVSGSSATPMVYLDVKEIVKALESFQPSFADAGVPILGEAGGLQRLMDTVGVGTMESISLAIAPAGEGFKTTLFLHAPGLAKGSGSLLDAKPLSQADLAVVPADASGASVAQFDLLGVYRSVLRAAQSLAPEVHADLIQMIGEFEGKTGVKIEDDLVGAFGDTWAVFDAPSQGGLWVTGITLVVDVKPGNRLDQAIGRITLFIADAARGEAEVTVQTGEYRGQRISFVNVAGVPMPVAPAWAQYEGRCIIALYPQMVRSALDHMMDKTPSLLDNPDFRRGFERLPAGASAISYVDTRAGVELVYRFVLPIGQALMAMGQAEGIPLDVSMLPSARTLTKHLFGNVSAMVPTGDGLLSVAHGALPVAIPSIGAGGTAVPVLAAIVLPSLARARALARRAVSSSNLHQVGMGMIAYATENRDQLPPDLESIVEKYLGGSSVLVSPLDRSGAKNSYVYLAAGLKLSSFRQPSRTIIVYEKPEDYDGEGTSVLFADGHVEFMQMDRFERELERTKREIEGLKQP